MEMNNRKRISLNSNWKFALHKSSGKSNLNIGHNLEPGKYFPAEVPGTIHTDLYKNKIIEDPFYSDNELKLQWISQNDWVYETEFDFSEINTLKQDLVFEGLDTISEIYLNDKKIDSTDNMFLGYRYNVSKILKFGQNILKIIFHSPVRYADVHENKYGKLAVALSSNRVHIRKAQYSFGWDWGPIFTTSGIWKDVYLEERPKIFIEDLTFSTKSFGKNKATVSVIPFLSDAPKGKYSVRAEISNANQRFVKKNENIKAKNPEINLVIQEPQLWWPNGEGEQNLYQLNVKLIDDKGQLIDAVNKSIGIRKIELIEKENNKAVFKIKVNGRIVYCKGANWIPILLFTASIN